MIFVDQHATKRIRISDEGNQSGRWICACNVVLDFISSVDSKFLQHTPSKPLAEVKNSIQRILQRYRLTMRTLVRKAGRQPLFPSWIPEKGSSDAVDSDMAFRNHVKALTIPAVDGLPSLLLHDLGSETSITSQKQAEYISDIFSLHNHTCVDN